jgi:phenylpropionate dioxygenase-like ring-hydroxylating dioxygenase large terminal subunit
MASEDTYLRNTWYVAALAEEVGEGLLRRVLLGTPVVLFRSEADGSVAALLDRCPHRYAPLSLGRRVEGGVQCAYHGLAFAPSGACILNPHGDGRILPSARVRSFPTVERHGLVWLWPGEVDSCDPDRIPDLGYLDAADPRTRLAGYLPTAANYELLTDNILDLSHADFLHPFLNSSGGTRAKPPRVEEAADASVMVTWEWGPGPALPAESHHFGPEQDVHTRITVRWYAPAVMRLSVTTALTPEGLEQGPTGWAMHIMTPETEHSTHYFFGGVRNFLVDDEEFTSRLATGLRMAFMHEDKPMIEAVQANMMGETDIFALKPLGLIGDAGGVRVRNSLRRMVKAERDLARGKRMDAGLPLEGL